ncbi:hypothetical protein BC937DRAFT_87785 [Endogone sp. FLAS-F59071]|nr:hypothetical protein BC937DRAFT_87785 [Endogone sp. FLAS-F59071]|eukprot:RUS19244.1 hypothetical protein BC937DRAFT_87785 [Endogone sp. FLAS-F59071]
MAWTQEDVLKYVMANQNRDLRQVDIDIIKKHLINGVSFLQLTRDELQKMGMVFGPAAMIMNLVNNLKNSESGVSLVANSKAFKEYQEIDENPLILCSRPPDAVDLPVALYDPILAKFQADAEGDIQPDEDDLAFILNLSYEMCSLSFKNENGRRYSFQALISEYLERSLVNYTLQGNRCTDGSIFAKHSYDILLLNLEVKPELGIGHACPYLQSCLYYAEHISKTLSHAPNPSRLPAFLLYLAVTLSTFSSNNSYTGPYLGIAAAVFLERPVCEPITPLMPLFYLPHNKSMMLQTARSFKALKIALANLEEFYIEGTKRELEYIKKVGGCYVFEAKVKETSDNPSIDVIVKFSKTYSKKCHRACYKLGISPELFACKRIPGGWYIVVMALLKNHDTLYTLAQCRQLSQSIKKQAVEAVKKMHEKGFVHGDMRLPNIMAGPNNSIKIIDFDWAGKRGEAVYPFFRNLELEWHDDVKAQ